MIIRSAEFQGYGPFTRRTFEFRRGLNLVYGPNESGKSILMESVAVALYGGREKQNLQSWGLDGDCKMTLLLEGKGSSVRLNRDLASGRISFLHTDDMYRTLFRFEGVPDAESEDEQARQLAEQLQEIFGLSGAEEFRDILTFQQERGPLQTDGMLSSHILALCHQDDKGDDIALNRAVAEIEQEYLSQTNVNPWGEDLPQDGPLQRIRHQLAELEESWYLRQKSLKSVSQLRKEMAGLEIEVEMDESELDRGETFLKRFRTALTAGSPDDKSPSGELDEIDAEREKVFQLIRRREDLIDERESLSPGDDSDEEVMPLAEEAEEARQGLHGLQAETAELRRELITAAGPSWLFPTGAMACFFALAGVLAFLYPDLMTVAMLGALFLSLLGWVLHIWLLSTKRSEIAEKKERMLALDRQREMAQDRLAEIDERLENAGLPVSSRDLEHIRERTARLRELDNELDDIESALSTMKDPVELDARRQKVLGENPADGAEVKDQDQNEDMAGPESVAEAEQRLEKFRIQLNDKKVHLQELHRQRKEAVAEVRDLGTIEREGEQLKGRESRICRRLAVLATARELLCRIEGRHEGGGIEKLAEAIGRHTRHLTGGRYRQIRIDDRGSILLKARGGTWEPLPCFGRATVDAVGVAVPMALIDIFFHDRSVPLLLDEPLVNLDQKRMDETLKQLEQMAAHHQIILFSHQESLLKRAAKSGWNLITLNGKEARRSSPDDERSKDDEQQQLHLL
ncbi:MAG: AAA family ATPase [Desulfuromonadales bacterium]